MGQAIEEAQGMIRTAIGRVIPKSVKDRIIYPYVIKRKARKLAQTSKRLDICAAQFAHVLHLAGGVSLEGKTCLEIGCGWVLSHALVCYLLGAKRIIATDLQRIFYPSALKTAVHEAVASIPRDLLAPFSDYTALRERYTRLLEIKDFRESDLHALGIEYLSPVDIASKPLGIAVDLVYSLSVLEHVPKGSIRPLLSNLLLDLNPGGSMLHCVHLEDHQNFEAPFDFLGVPSGKYPLKSEVYRGNRVRRSEWDEIFSELKDSESRILYSYIRREQPLPKAVDPAVRFKDENDLRTTHIGVLTRKLS
jgi:cyclopropane fatty-acyl-phospholipid synthase-like methyltransferase